MSVHFSRYNLNTYSPNPFFSANMPKDYPIGTVCVKSRAFRRLPKNVKKLAALAKQYSMRTNPQYQEDIGRWYDDEGYELNPDTRDRLTDEEIDDSWRGVDETELAKIKVEDIPEPSGGFPDPDTWEEPAPPPSLEEDEDKNDGRPTHAQLLKDIGSHGVEYTAKYYGIPADQATNKEALARAIMEKRRSRRKPPTLEKDPVSGPANAP